MSEQTVNATYNNSDTGEKLTASVVYDFGENAAAAIDSFGDDVVLTNYRKSAVITLQGVVRRALQSGLSGEQVADRAAAWRPGVASERVQADPMQAAVAAFSGKTDEEQAEFIKQLQAAAKAKG